MLTYSIAIIHKYDHFTKGRLGMSFRQKLTKYFNNHAQTSENHLDPALETRYYKTTKDKGLKMLERLVKNSQDYEVHSISTEHGEMSILIQKGRKAFIVATVIMVRPYQTAIDFAVTTESPFPIDFAYNTKVIQQLYNGLDKEITLIDKAQHKNQAP